MSVVALFVLLCVVTVIAIRSLWGAICIKEEYGKTNRHVYITGIIVSILSVAVI